MPHATAKSKSESIGQAELDALRPILARIARVAKTMFGAPAADICIFQGEDTWRAADADESLPSDPASAMVRDFSEVIWVEDLAADPRFRDHPGVTGVPHLRFYAGAPISLSNGVSIGALAVYGMKPRPRDELLAGRLRDLSEVVGHECDLALAQAERVALLDKVKRQEERLNIAAKAASLHVFELDFVEQTLIRTGDESAFFNTDVTYDDLTAGHYSYVHPEDRAKVRGDFERRTNDTVGTEWRLNRQDGEDFWVQASTKMFRDGQGRPLRLVGSLQNITDRKRTEKSMAEAKAFADAANLAKSAFLATMSHEIRTPLNGVLGMAQAMASDDLSTVQRDRLDVVRQSGESLLAILNDLLDFSKIEAGKLELEAIDFDLAEIAQGAYAAFTAIANRKGLSFVLNVDAAKGAYRGDPTRVRQILYNLISNALKFTNEGEIRVSAHYDGKALNFTVSDTGIGMSAETKDGLFAKFSQADASTTRKFGGTGLGLAICRELTSLMDGSIVVDSEEGRGSTFQVRLPLLRVGDALAKLSTPVVETNDEMPGLNLRVLAAEDNTVNQLVLKTLLHQIGVQPTIVENGKLAVEAWERDGPWDLVLMDVQMPIMDGQTAVRAIRAREAELGCGHTPVIALTANAMSHQVAEYREAGMDGHLAKPLEAAKLFEVLASVLDVDDGPEALRA